MKKLLLILLCLHILGCGGGKKENTLTMHNIKGKVKEIIEREFNVKESFGDLEKSDLVFRQWKRYDDDGNETEFNHYDKDGVLEWKQKYIYDDDGNNTEMNTYDKDGELISKYKLKDDDDGNETEFNHYDKDGELETSEKYKYDDEGFLTESFTYDKDGNLEMMYKHKYEFDEKNNWIVKTLYEYDKPTNITEREIEYYY
jgi:hypothetical protein